ncbi:MAG TPA: ABC-type transport auxiliary lipoprotein family protein [Candidatus Saccharimonadia bacterium]|nr:ABC-type transport auxiliary lipoprotein family protein [Candidatus Saccharimonadia bacterium]
MTTPRGLILLLAALGLSSCQLLGSKKEDFAIYGVELTAPPGKGEPVEWQLVIDEPVAADPTRGSRIVLKPEDRAYGVYKGARWTDRATELVQALMIEAFESSNRIVGLGRSSSSVRGDFMLMTELRAFEARYDAGAAVAHIEISAKLVHAARNEVVAAKVFEADAPAAGRDVASVVPAFEVAVNEALAALVGWTFEQGNANATEAEPES